MMCKRLNSTMESTQICNVWGTLLKICTVQTLARRPLMHSTHCVIFIEGDLLIGLGNGG